MHFSTAVIAAFAATYVSASPIVLRDNTCGAAPAGSNTNNQPIAQPSGVQTSDACQTQCEANASCKSFCFGLVDNAIQCKLFSVAASVVPTQSSPNLVVYDKACPSVPSVVPTTSNPTGKKQDNSQTQIGNDSGSKTSEQKAQESKKAEASKTGGQPAQESKKAEASKTNSQQAQQSKVADASKTNIQQTTEQKQVQSSNDNNSGTQKQTTDKNTSASTCGTKPSASTNQQPFSTPAVSSEAACKTKCQADSSCKSFTCGKVDNTVVCKLYTVAAAQVPAPTYAAQKNALKAYDVGCSM